VILARRFKREEAHSGHRYGPAGLTLDRGVADLARLYRDGKSLAVPTPA
jgi:hypothetical protein